MTARKSSHLDRILGRVDDLDFTNLTILVQRLARERELLETVFNAIDEGILVVDLDGLIEYSNASANTMIGLKENELGKAVLWKVMPDLARSLDFRLYGRSEQAPTITRELEITYPERRFVRLYMVPFEVPDDGQPMEKIAILLSDITEHKASTEERIESEKIKSIFDLAAGVAHELGNPLNSINIHLQLIRKRLEKLENSPSRDRIGESVDVCANEVQRLDGIISHFLQAIRPQDPDLQDVSLLEVLTEVLRFQSNEIHDLGIELDVELKAEVPLILGDRNQLKQVFFNLTKNAMEAMDSGGDLRITASSDDEFVFVYIADTGVGMSQDDVARVFNPYFTSKASGHGLGMMIVHRILRAHGAQIGIDSRAGQGTVVTLQFPQKSRRFRMLESSD